MTNVINKVEFFKEKITRAEQKRRDEELIHNLARNFILQCRSGNQKEARKMLRHYITEDMWDHFKEVMEEEQLKLQQEIDYD